MRNPFIPERFPKNKAGMANDEWLTGWKESLARRGWLAARTLAVFSAKVLMKLGVHKQIANRLLEPFMWVTSVTTATEWKNFFSLRCSPLAQPEIMKVALMMQEEYRTSKPKLIKKGEWHLPYVTEQEKIFHKDEAPLLSAGRCGKVSYLTHGISNMAHQDISIARDKMVGNRHWSPVEHPATPMDTNDFNGNFKGWKQQRKFYEGESGE